MKPTLITIALCSICLFANAQTIVTLPVDSNKIFSFVEKMPEYPGGMKKFDKYVEKNLRYPSKSIKNETGGNVQLTFVVERDGSLTGVRIIKSVSPEIDAEAIR